MPSIRPWCGGKCLPLKVTGRRFESGNQPLQRKFGGKAAYQSPLLDPAKWESCALSITFMYIAIKSLLPILLIQSWNYKV